MSNKSHIIHPATAANCGATADQIEACANWNGDAGASAYQGGDYELATRFWLQADALRASVNALRLAKAA